MTKSGKVNSMPTIPCHWRWPSLGSPRIDGGGYLVYFIRAALLVGLYFRDQVIQMTTNTASKYDSELVGRELYVVLIEGTLRQEPGVELGSLS